MPDETKLRGRIDSIYNKKEEDFESRREFDDYLEEKEDIVLSLLDEERVAETEAKIAEYQRQNYANIVANAARQAEEARATAGALFADTGGREGREADPANLRGPARPFQLQPQPLSEADTGPAPATTPEESHRRMADASGWRPEFVRQRALAEAYGSVFVH